MTEVSKMTIGNKILVAAAALGGVGVSNQGMSKGEDDEDDNNTMEEDDDVDDDDEVGINDDNTAGDENVDGEGKANRRFSILLNSLLDVRRVEVAGEDNADKRWFG